MKSEDMKMEKFKILVSDIDHYLGGSRLYSNGIRIVDNIEYRDGNPLLYLIDEKSNESWLECILKNSFQCKYSLYSCSERIKLCEIEKNNTMEFIREIRKCKGSNCPKGRRCNAASHLMFWLLFVISVDNENYNNNLNVAADVAFLLDFDEETLNDWITAVKGVLSGKKLYELEYKTEDGRGFFIRDDRY